ncbi:MAG TPA: matrixin family metalloprotease [Bacteriovoracaceae bacterium]|nr:matrixin family metalloprotease [Bacteriovoracaceae bacterium]
MWIKWILIFSVSLPAWAYNLTSDFQNGFYWASLPIDITVVDRDETRKRLIETIAKRAIGEWESSTGLSLWDYKESGTSNVIRWSENFGQETNMDPLSVLAVAIRYTVGPYFAKTEIVINGSHFLNHDLDHLYTTLTHEFGHTMGLDHSDSSLAVMAPTLQDPYNGLQGDDVQGLQVAQNEMVDRQVNRYVSPLAYSKESSTTSPLSCGTVGASAPAGGGAMVSLAVGMLIGFVRKIFLWLKSLF